MTDYKTSKGRLYSFDGWQPDDSPLEHFDQKNWLKCLHGVCFMLSHFDANEVKQSLEDDGILHELIHLSLGVEICTHQDLEYLRACVADIQARFDHEQDQLQDRGQVGID